MDTKANIVAICSTCHTKIHGGPGFRGLLKIIYTDFVNGHKHKNIEESNIHGILYIRNVSVGSKWTKSLSGRKKGPISLSYMFTLSYNIVK